MQSNIINIGNNQGIILPATLLQQLKLTEKSSVQIEIDNGTIVIKPLPREGWAEAARQTNAENDDELLLKDISTEFDEQEWTW